MSRTALATAVFLVLLCGPAAAQPADAIPEWADGLALFLTGGAPAGDVEIRLNGEVVAQVAGKVPPRIEIADRLRHGLNEIEVEVRPAASRSPGNERLSVYLARSRRLNEKHSLIEDPILQFAVPADPAPDCVEQMRFWAGPPEAPSKLKGRYWVVAAGPPARHRVTTVLNGTPVYSASSGDSYLEVTPFVKKGKNVVVFETRPTCLVESSDRSDPLEITVAAGWLELDNVMFADPPLSTFELEVGADSEPTSRRKTFRGF